MIVLNSVLPAFIIIGLGFFLKRKKIISNDTDMFLNNLAYYLILPCMIFSSVYKLPFKEIFNIKIILGLYLVALSVFLLSVFIGNFIPYYKRGAFVTVSFRSNIAYIGFPIIYSIYGEGGLGKISLITGFIAPFIIFLSIVYLSMVDTKRKHENIFSYWVKDPLIITSILAIIFSYFKLYIPEFLFNTIHLLSLMGAPLMLMAVGSGLKIEKINEDKVILFIITMLKLIIMPFLSFLLFKFLLKLEDSQSFNIAVLTFSFPTALSSYVLVKKYNSDYNLCAAAITTTTILSIFSISFLTYFLIK